MKKLVLFFFLSFSMLIARGQELACEVEINASQLEVNDPTLFQSLEEVIFEFINNRKWTSDAYKNFERIECSILINLNSGNGGNYSGTIQIGSRRPVYGTSLNTTMINYLDKDMDFTYQQFEVLEFSENTFISNLTSVLAFYIYYVLGIDYDSFSPDGGTPYFQKALQVVNNAQSADEPGWQSFENQMNRYWIIENTLSPRFKELRQAYYVYHRQGLDKMQENPEEGRKKIYEALELCKQVHENIPNSINLRMFFNAKSDEIIDIFSEAPREEKNKVINLLNTVDPANTIKYQKILD